MCKGVPIDIWMSTGVRSVDHCVELLSRVTDPDETVDEDAKKGVILLSRGLIKLKRNPDDAEERLNTLIGAGLAMEGESDS